MNIIPGSRKRHYLARVGIFLITAAFIAAMVGCDVDVTRYDLTISSTVGGSVTIPGEGVFTYYEGRVVDLVTEAEEGYRFVEWTGDVDNIADVYATATNITMNGDYSITANFVRHYDLTTFSTAGGSVTRPGEGVFTYDEGTVVDLIAWAEDGYQFAEWTGDVDTVANVNAATTNITMEGNYSITANFEWFDIIQIDAGYYFTVGLKSDGTVAAVGNNENGACDVGGWTGINQTAAGSGHTVGLKSDGTVVAVGHDWYGQCDVGNWMDIIQVTAGWGYTVGLKADGTVVAVGQGSAGQCDVGNWTGITQVDGGGSHTVGLKSDGTVVAVGHDSYGQCDVGSWSNIIQVAAGSTHTLGLKADGTVIAVGDNNCHQCEIDDWTDITQVDGYVHTVGLKSDGTAVALGVGYCSDGSPNDDYGQCDLGDWTDITQVAAGRWHTVGLKSDGTVLAVGDNILGQCDV